MLWFLPFVVGQELNPDDMLFGAKKVCPAFRCPGEEVVPRRPLRLQATGSCNLGGAMMFSKEKEKEPLGKCCGARQACDQVCGASLKLCDEAFELCMNTTCAGDKECEKSASMHKLMQQLGDGCKKFVPAQNAACECTTDAGKRRRQILTDVYKKVGEEKDVGALVDKANTPKKFAALLVKLIAKYPSLVKLVQDPQQAYFDNLMKEANKPPPVDDTNIDDGDVIDLDNEL